MMRILLILLLITSFFGPRVSQAATQANTVPSSTTSQAAYRQVAPRLIATMQKMGLALGDPVFIRLFKSEKKLEVWVQNGISYRLFKTYTICYHSGNLGPKIREGDRQSPEGFYTVSAGQLNPNSDYHLSFNLGFPNEYDKSYHRTGSLLMVHGRCSSVGCFAMTDFRMDEIYTLVESAIIAGQQKIPVHIFPFKMTNSNMIAYQDSQWIEFWQNLKEGYDYFEGQHNPPEVTVQEQRYQFSTVPTLLFGGNLPPKIPRLRPLILKRKGSELLLPAAPLKPRYIAKIVPLSRPVNPTPSAPALLGQGD